MNLSAYLFGAAAMLAATPALALDLEKSVEAKATPAKVWSTVGDFCAIAKWHPAVEACTPGTRDGAEIRTLTLAGGGGTLVEALVERDDAKMSYTYRILEGPLPVQNYTSTLSVSADDDGDASKIGWRGTFEAKGASDAEASKVIEGIYDAGLAALVAKSGS